MVCQCNEAAVTASTKRIYKTAHLVYDNPYLCNLSYLSTHNVTIYTEDDESKLANCILP